MSPAQIIERNQQNAQHSTGPRTEEGKAVSSQNARKHGLSGKLLLKSQAEMDRYQKRVAEVARYYRLNNPLASATIEALVTAEFRRAQAFAAEQDVLVQLKLQVIDELTDGAPDPSDEELDGLARLKDAQTTKLVPQLNRHYNAADRAWRRHYKVLTEMQAAEESAGREMAELNTIRASFERLLHQLGQNKPTSEPETSAPVAASETNKGRAA